MYNEVTHKGETPCTSSSISKQATPSNTTQQIKAQSLDATPTRKTWNTELSVTSFASFKDIAMKTITRTGLIREVKLEEGKYYAWNEIRLQWYRIAKTKVVK